MAPPKLPPAQDSTLFGLMVQRVPGGYRAQARVATNRGFVLFSTDATYHEAQVGAIEAPPKTTAVKETLTAARDFALSPHGQTVVPNETKSAILTTLGLRELVERAAAGDPKSKVGLALVAQHPNRTIRKAIQAQRLFEE